MFKLRIGLADCHHASDDLRLYPDEREPRALTDDERAKVTACAVAIVSRG